MGFHHIAHNVEGSLIVFHFHILFVYSEMLKMFVGLAKCSLLSS